MLRDYTHEVYACPGCRPSSLRWGAGGPQCIVCGACFANKEGFLDFTHPPILASETSRHRSHFDELACGYDALMERMFGASEPVFKERLVQGLDVPLDGTVLEVGVGTGRNLPLIDRTYGGRLTLYGIDLSPGMLRGSLQRASDVRYPIELAIANAEYLPYADNVFDSVLHFGFINDFPDPGQAIREMIRVAKPGAKVVISDDGFPPAMRASPIARDLIAKNRAFGADPPVHHLPAEAYPYELQWFLGAFYIITFRKTQPSPAKEASHA